MSQHNSSGDTDDGALIVDFNSPTFAPQILYPDIVRTGQNQYSENDHSYEGSTAASSLPSEIESSSSYQNPQIKVDTNQDILIPLHHHQPISPFNLYSPTAHNQFSQLSPTHNNQYSQLSPTHNTHNNQFSPTHNNQFSPTHNNQFSPTHNNQFSPTHNNQFSPTHNNQFSQLSPTHNQSPHSQIHPTSPTARNPNENPSDSDSPEPIHLAEEDENNSNPQKDEKKDDHGIIYDEVPVNSILEVSLWTLFRYATKMDKFLLCIAVLAAIASGGIMPAVSIVIGLYTERVATTTSYVDSILLIVWIFLAFGAVATVSCYLHVGLWMYLAEKQCKMIRQKYLEALLRSETAYHDSQSLGELMVKLVANTDKIRDGMGQQLGQIVQSVCGFVIGLGIAFYYGWALALIIIACIPPLLIFAGLISTCTSKATTMEQQYAEKAGGIASQTFGGISVVKALQLEDWQLYRYINAQADWLQLSVRKGWLQGVTMGGFMLFIFNIYGLGFYIGATFIKDGTPAWPNHPYDGARVLTIFYALVLSVTILGQMAPQLRAYSTAKCAAYPLFETIDRHFQIDPFAQDGKQIDPSKFTGNLKFNVVSFAYPSRPDQFILLDLDMTIYPGYNAIISPSGGGKSTVLQLISRYYDPDYGTVEVEFTDDGILHKEETSKTKSSKKKQKSPQSSPQSYTSQSQISNHTPIAGDAAIAQPNHQTTPQQTHQTTPIQTSPQSDNKLTTWIPMHEMHVHSLRNLIAVCHQEPVVFTSTIRVNLLLGAPQATDQDMIQALTYAGLWDFVQTLPNQLDFVVSSKVLSGGQCQRLSFARALIADKPILILDEFCASLDINTTKFVHEQLHKWMQVPTKEHGQKKTVISVTHKLATVRQADDIFVLEQGRVSQHGTHTQLFNDVDGYYRRVVDEQLIFEIQQKEAQVAQDQILHQQQQRPSIQNAPIVFDINSLNTHNHLSSQDSSDGYGFSPRAIAGLSMHFFNDPNNSSNLLFQDPQLPSPSTPLQSPSLLPSPDPQLQRSQFYTQYSNQQRFLSPHTQASPSPLPLYQYANSPNYQLNQSHMSLNQGMLASQPTQSHRLSMNSSGTVGDIFFEPEYYDVASLARQNSLHSTRSTQNRYVLGLLNQRSHHANGNNHHHHHHANNNQYYHAPTIHTSNNFRQSSIPFTQNSSTTNQQHILDTTTLNNHSILLPDTLSLRDSFNTAYGGAHESMNMINLSLQHAHSLSLNPPLANLIIPSDDTQTLTPTQRNETGQTISNNTSNAIVGDNSNEDVRTNFSYTPQGTPTGESNNESNGTNGNNIVELGHSRGRLPSKRLTRPTIESLDREFLPANTVNSTIPNLQLNIVPNHQMQPQYTFQKGLAGHPHLFQTFSHHSRHSLPSQNNFYMTATQPIDTSDNGSSYQGSAVIGPISVISVHQSPQPQYNSPGYPLQQSNLGATSLLRQSSRYHPPIHQATPVIPHSPRGPINPMNPTLQQTSLSPNDPDAPQLLQQPSYRPQQTPNLNIILPTLDPQHSSSPTKEDFNPSSPRNRLNPSSPRNLPSLRNTGSSHQNSDIFAPRLSKQPSLLQAPQQSTYQRTSNTFGSLIGMTAFTTTSSMKAPIDNDDVYASHKESGGAYSISTKDNTSNRSHLVLPRFTLELLDQPRESTQLQRQKSLQLNRTSSIFSNFDRIDRESMYYAPELLPETHYAAHMQLQSPGSPQPTSPSVVETKYKVPGSAKNLRVTFAQGNGGVETVQIEDEEEDSLPIEDQQVPLFMTAEDRIRWELDQRYIIAQQSYKMPPSQLLGPVFKQLWPYFKEYKMLMTIGLVAALLEAVSTPAYAMLLKYILEGFFLPDRQEMMIRARNTALAFFGVAVAYFFIATVRNGVLSMAGERITHDIRRIAFRVITYQDLYFFDLEQHTQAILSTQLSSDVTHIKSIVTDFMADMAMCFSLFVSSIIISYIEGWQLSTLMLGLLPIISGCAVIQHFFLTRKGQAQHIFDQPNQDVSEALTHIRVIATYRQENQILQGYTKAAEEFCSVQAARANIAAIWTSLSFATLFGCYALSFYFGAWCIDRGYLQPMGMIQIFTAMQMTANFFSTKIQQSSSYSTALQHCSSIFSLINSERPFMKVYYNQDGDDIKSMKDLNDLTLLASSPAFLTSTPLSDKETATPKSELNNTIANNGTSQDHAAIGIASKPISVADSSADQTSASDRAKLQQVHPFIDIPLPDGKDDKNIDKKDTKKEIKKEKFLMTVDKLINPYNLPHLHERVVTITLLEQIDQVEYKVFKDNPQLSRDAQSKRNKRRIKQLLKLQAAAAASAVANEKSKSKSVHSVSNDKNNTIKGTDNNSNKVNKSGSDAHGDIFSIAKDNDNKNQDDDTLTPATSTRVTRTPGSRVEMQSQLSHDQRSSRQTGSFNQSSSPLQHINIDEEGDGDDLVDPFDKSNSSKRPSPSSIEITHAQSNSNPADSIPNKISTLNNGNESNSNPSKSVAVVAGTNRKGFPVLTTTDKLPLADSKLPELTTLSLSQRFRNRLTAQEQQLLAKFTTYTISFKDVFFAFPTRPQQLVFKGLNLDFIGGTYSCILGTSGSGKSALLSLIMRMYEPTPNPIITRVLYPIPLSQSQMNALQNQSSLHTKASLKQTPQLNQNQNQFTTASILKLNTPPQLKEFPSSEDAVSSSIVLQQQHSSVPELRTSNGVDGAGSPTQQTPSNQNSIERSTSNSRITVPSEIRNNNSTSRHRQEDDTFYITNATRERRESISASHNQHIFNSYTATPSSSHKSIKEIQFMIANHGNPLDHEHELEHSTSSQSQDIFNADDPYAKPNNIPASLHHLPNPLPVTSTDDSTNPDSAHSSHHRHPSNSSVSEHNHSHAHHIPNSVSSLGPLIHFSQTQNIASVPLHFDTLSLESSNIHNTNNPNNISPNKLPLHQSNSSDTGYGDKFVTVRATNAPPSMHFQDIFIDHSQQGNAIAVNNTIYAVQTRPSSTAGSVEQNSYHPPIIRPLYQTTASTPVVPVLSFTDQLQPIGNYGELAILQNITGTICIDGVDIRTLSNRTLRHLIGFVSQFPVLFTGTIMDNLRCGYGIDMISDEEVYQACKTAYIHDVIMGLPDKYDTLLGGTTSGLSGGQRARLSLGRSLLMDTPILLIDELTANLDNKSAEYINMALKTFMKGRTVIMIAHRLDLIAECDNIVVLNQGEVQEQGTHDQLLALNGFYAHSFATSLDSGPTTTASANIIQLKPPSTAKSPPDNNSNIVTHK